MKKSARLSLLLAGLLVVLSLILILVKKQPQLILFYSDSCPHCQNLESYIVQNNVKSYLDFKELEVSKNQANAQLLAKDAASCGLSTDSIGVPFFFDGTQCLVGDENIIQYFASKK
jgi:glutaredoxin